MPRRDSKGRFLPKRKSRRKRSRSRKRRRARNMPRDSRGRFVSKTGSRRRRRRSSSRRRKRNPDLLDQVTTGATDALSVLGGKAAARAIPETFGLPRAGMTGLLVSAAAAVAVGWAGDRFVSRDVGRFALAGGLSAPLEALIVAQNVPFVSRWLGPGAASADLGRYVQGRDLGRYARPGMSGYAGGAGSRLPASSGEPTVGSYAAHGSSHVGVA